MRILELTLTNFTPILSGMGKESVTLNLRDSPSLINVLIGKIGSGKTYLLSHLQPFATVGTLDVRNQDDPIVEGKDGKKVIIYEKDNHEYVITHDYHWTGKTHSKKSYFEKDGEELNTNGNSSSFKELVKLEFGIEPAHLQLLRLGPNVVNFIHMKSTERKEYVANLLQETEIYLLLYKYWSSELRTLNTKSSILMNKLQSYGDKSIEELETDYETIQDEKREKESALQEKLKQKYELEGENKSHMGGRTYADLMDEKSQLKRHLQEMIARKEELTSLLETFQKSPEITDVSKELGRLDQALVTIGEEKQSLEDAYEAITSECTTLRDRKAIQSNTVHMETLRQTHTELEKKINALQKELSGFSCSYSSATLSSLIDELEGMNVLISEIAQYDTEIIQTIFHSDSSVISFARKKEEILGYRKLKVQRMINNLKFSEGYQPTSPLYFPPMCPTKTCPYYQTHPTHLQKQIGNKDETEAQLEAYKNEIQEIDVELYRYAEYPTVYAKISSVKKYWDKLYPMISDIGAVRCDSLIQILTLSQCQMWYHYDTIIEMIEKVEKKNQYYELTEKMKEIRHELTELENSEEESLDEQITILEQKKVQISTELEEKEKEHQKKTDELVSLNQLYIQLSHKSAYDSEQKEIIEEIQKVRETVNAIESNEESIQRNVQRIQELDRIIVEEQADLNQLSAKGDQIRTRLHDMRYTNQELDQVLTEQRYMKYMVEAVSSKKGIPLVMIQMFLDSCREIVNNLIYDVCEDAIEVLPFDIGEKDFKIPYLVNGQRIDDISKASQGQTSIVSTAISFAFVRKTGSTSYTIPLLDEMDAPLHKNDKQKFIAILLKHLETIGSEQCFVITHDDNTFDGYPVQVIMTTDETLNKEKYADAIKL